VGLLENLGLTENGRALREIRGELTQTRWQNEYLEESMRELEASMVGEGWRRMVVQSELNFSRSGLDDLMEISNAMYLSHPLIQRAVNVRAYYTWGQGITIKVEDDRVQEDIIKPFIEEHGNQATLFSHQARILTDVDQQVDGNTCFALFTDRLTGDVRVRNVPIHDIREVITSPDDITEVWFYRRRWRQKVFDIATGNISYVEREAFYPDYSYNPPSKPRSAGPIPILWESPIIHLRTGGRKSMLFGVPETYAALDWARAYRKFLEDWHTIVSSLAKFAWRATVRGSKVQSTKAKFGSTVRGASTETNPAPPAGSVFVAPDGSDLSAIPKSGANTSADDARPSRLMVGAAMDLPDTILSGDADVGNHATAKTLDRPTELAIVSRQFMWTDHHLAIFNYMIEQKIRASKLPDDDPGLDISFPPILEHDPVAVVNAIVAAATLDGKVEAGTVPTDVLARLLMQAIGVDDIDAALAELAREEQDTIRRAVDNLGRQIADIQSRQNADPTVPPDPTIPPELRR
jgi:hypothetical protein